MKYPFEASLDEIEANPEPYIDAIFSSLESEFLVLPKGDDFLDYPQFERAYEMLKRATNGFDRLQGETVLATVHQFPLTLIVLRTMLGFTPPEWAYVAARRKGIEISQNFARSIDRKIRANPFSPLRLTKITAPRVEALVTVACELLSMPAPQTEEDKLHRLQKADSQEGLITIRGLSRLGVPYAMLLYERFLGRPFAGHRDSVSELVGNLLESAIAKVLDQYGIDSRQPKRAERIAGFDQTPDFIVPDEYNPQVVIEAKVTEDDGTARDKVTRVQHLDTISRQRSPDGQPRFEVIACIAGRGFGVRREDMKKLLLATRGKVFTLQTLDQLVTQTRLSEFRTR